MSLKIYTKKTSSQKLINSLQSILIVTSQTYLQPSFNTQLLSLPRFNICFLSGFHIILILALPGVLVSTVGLCIVVACPVDPMVAACPVIQPVAEPVFWVVGPVVWVAVLIRLHSFNVIVVFT